MSGLFDQYEESTTRSAIQSRVSPILQLQPVASGYVTAIIDEEVPIFSKQRINFKPPNTVTHLTVCNKFLVLAMTKDLFRLDLEHPDNPDEMTLASPVTGDKVHKLFLDPTGRHLIVNMELSKETYYISRSSKKPKNLSKLRGLTIEAIGWNKQNASENSTGAILIGTKKGQIFEAEIQSGDSSSFFQANLEQYCKQLISLGENQPITEIEFDRIPLSSSKNEQKYFIMVTTPGRLYQYVGLIPVSTEPPIFQHVIKENDGGEQARFLELPGDFGRSSLQLYYSKYRGQPTSFAWMTGPGIFHGNIDTTGAAGQDSVTVETKLMQYPSDDMDVSQPLSIVLTEFHVLVLYEDRVRAMCVMNEQLVFDDIFLEKFGKLLGLCHDPLMGTIWVYGQQAVFKYKVTKESRDVWQMYLDKGEFDLAKEYCKGNPANMDKVLTRQAEHFFHEKRYEQSAMLYALTQNSFEEIALKFVMLENKEALKHFLHKKLNSLQANEITQQTMLVTWLVEIYLNQLGQLRERGVDQGPDYESVQDEFRRFLAKSTIKVCVKNNSEIIYNLIASHGDVEDMVYFAVLRQDYKRVIGHYIQHEDFGKALDVIKQTGELTLLYAFSPVLMENLPKETVDTWIKLGRQPDPKKLIPSLVQCNHSNSLTQRNEVTRYLEFAVDMLDNQDQAIHNYLLAIYAQHDPEKLMKYLEKQGQDRDVICYDMQYALRICIERDLQAACVHIYTSMGLYEEAVELALKFDVDLAKNNANKPTDDTELKKKLWLKIARHVVEDKKDIKMAMEFLHESSDLLKIEDILPFFPDFVTIDHFKDAICTSLEEYNEHIQCLHEEMNEATDSAKEIRDEIQSFRNRYAFVNSQDKCSVCHFPLMTRSFYAFPCMHKFHFDCLIAEILPHLSISKRNQVEDLQRELMSESASGRSNPTLKSQLEDLVAAECVYCGDIMIRSIDEPFIENEEYDKVMEGWL